MTFREWQQFTPTAAAHELHARVRTALTPAQQRAAIARLVPEQELAAAFARVNRNAPLGGVPFFVKDLFDVADTDTFAGSTFLPRVRPRGGTDSALVAALRRAGAVYAGKTQLHEFAYGITGENPHYGDCEHPRFPGRTTGGSSSGSAAVVAAGIVPLAVGTDTGGSIRVPAAFCGAYGLRLGAGEKFIADAFPLAPSFDTAGWFTANAADLLAMVRALVGEGISDRAPVGCYLELPGLDAETAVACRTAATALAPPADAATRRTLLDAFGGSVAVYNCIVAAEAWSVHAAWADRMRNEYDPAVWRRLEAGRHIDPIEVHRAHVAVAANKLTWAKFFLGHDFLILPATPCGALAKRDCTPENRTRLLTLTTPVSLAGLPVLTIPVPLPSGLTTGLQIVAHDARGRVFPWVLRRCATAAR